MSSSSSSSSSNGGGAYGFGVGLAGGASTAVAQQGQGMAALLVMLAVLCFIFAYCCWGAPFCRSLCRRHCCCRLENSDSESGGFGASTGPATTDQAMLATPTIILLPHGRMLVVDGTIITQFQAENTGLDLVELGESVMRAQRNTAGGAARHQLQNSQGSIIEMDAETPSKDSMGSLGCFPPPTYESIYGKDEVGDMPPSYSDILLHRFANLPFEIEMQEYASREHDSNKEEIEMRSLENCPHIISNPINGLAYPYGSSAAAATASYSSQSLPRSRRNPQLIGNPLNSYYLDCDNELAGSYRSQRRRSATSTNNSVLAVNVARTRRTSCGYNNRDEEDESQRRREPRPNAEETPAAATSENILNNRYAQSWDESSRSQNDAMNSRNSARSDSRRTIDDPDDHSRTNNPIFIRSRRRSDSAVEVVSLDNEQPVRMPRESRISFEQINWNLSDLDVRYAPDEQGRVDSRSGTECDEVNAEDDPSNFKALADIRESRV